MVRSERRRLLVALAGAAAILTVWLVYAPARRAAFVGEDHTLVRRDTRWKKAPVEALFTTTLWPESQTADVRVPHYRPVALASYRLDHALGGEASELHFTNVFLHAVACALLALVAARLGARGGAAVLAALAWALAPRLTEPVAWISGRADVLAGMLGLAALAVSPDVTTRVPSTGAPAWALGLSSAVLLFCALGSNDTALAFAVALVAAAAARRTGELRAPRARIVRAAACTLGPMLAFLALRTHALAAAPATATMQPDPGILAHVLVALEAIGRYVEMTIRATDPQTSIGAQSALDVPRALAGALVIAACAFAARRARHRIGIAAWTAGMLAVAAVGVAIARGAPGAGGAVTADRLLYVPLAGLAIGCAVAVDRLGARVARPLSVAAFVGLVVFAGATKARAEAYQDEIGFWVEAAERAHPANTYPRSSLAATVLEHGRIDLGCRLVDATRRIHEEHGRADGLGYRRAREAHAACLSRLGRFDEARQSFEELLRESPEVARLHMGLGFVRLHLLDFDGAEQAFRRAVLIDPVLGPTLRETMQELAKARAEAASFDTEEERRGDRFGYASFLASVGRADDAVREMTAVAEDRGQRIGARKLATWFLVNHADVALARRAGRTVYGDVLDGMDEELLRRRERSLAQVAAHEGRIEHLAAPAGAIAIR